MATNDFASMFLPSEPLSPDPDTAESAQQQGISENVFTRMLFPPIAAVDGSSRSRGIAMETVLRDIMNTTLNATLTRAGQWLGTTPAGQDIGRGIVSQQVGAWTSNPILWIGVAIAALLIFKLVKR